MQRLLVLLMNFILIVCKLHKSLYGLKQAPQGCLFELGFSKSTSVFSIFYKFGDGMLLMILVYVDDILLTGDSSGAVHDVIQVLHFKFALKILEEVHYFFGC